MVCKRDILGGSKCCMGYRENYEVCGKVVDKGEIL